MASPISIINAGRFQVPVEPSRRGEWSSTPGRPLRVNSQRQQWRRLQHLLSRSTLRIPVKHRRRDGFGPSHLSSCRVVALFSSNWSNGGLSRGVDWFKWPACRIWRPQPWAVWDGSAGTGACLGSTVCNGLRAKFDGVGAVGRTTAGAVGRLAFDGCRWYSSQSNETGPIGTTSISLAVVETMVPEPRGLESPSLFTWLWSPDQQSYAPVLESPTRALAWLRLRRQLISGGALVVSCDRRSRPRLRRLRLSHLTAGRPPPVDVMGTEPVCAPSWNYLTGPDRVVGTSPTGYDDIRSAAWHSRGVLGNRLHPWSPREHIATGRICLATGMCWTVNWYLATV